MNDGFVVHAIYEITALTVEHTQLIAQLIVFVYNCLIVFF